MAVAVIAAAVLAPAAAIGDDGARRYGGVTPGSASAAPAPARGAWTSLTWLGFLPEHEGKTRVFLQLGREVNVEQAIVDDELWVMLERVQPGSRNATRPLDVRFFSTDLASVEAARIGRRPARGDRPAQPDGMRIAIRFADPENARRADVSIAREQDGYHYLYLDF